MVTLKSKYVCEIAIPGPKSCMQASKVAWCDTRDKSSQVKSSSPSTLTSTASLESTFDLGFPYMYS